MSKAPTHVLILGGGFGGVFTAKHLEKLFAGNPDVQITLVSRDNFFLMTPLLFEAMTGSIEFRHCSVPIRDFLRRTTFIEATVDQVDIEKRMVIAYASEGEVYRLEFDHLVLALGAKTDQERISGSEHAFTFKALADAIVLRNHIIERFERADAEMDSARRKQLLTFAVIGGGLVGIEVFGELTAFVMEIVRYYPHVNRDEIQFLAFHAAHRILEEVDPKLADYATRVLQKRQGVSLHLGEPVQRIERDCVHVKSGSFEAGTIILAAGITRTPVVDSIPLEKGRHGQLAVDATMRSAKHPGVWALGDCAAIPRPDGKHYPYLAQHAMREGRLLAQNIHAVIQGRPPKPFIYDSLGIMGSIGHHTGFGRIMGIRVRGFAAWWIRRTYYLFVMPRWSRRIRIIADWTMSLLFRPDIVKIDIARENALVRRHAPAGTAVDTASSR
ncbi:MAG TPA: NAD(P)/FAD-dependent oxidoreductase [Tepidisphaeraceae bacterium]|nr:NAD(P)/FAD-dependent oxidoreductase [Tepidisphaeraceae bacterium]